MGSFVANGKFLKKARQTGSRNRRARRPRRAGSNTHVTATPRRIRSRPIVGKGLAPSGSRCSDKRRPPANSQTCRGFAGGRAMSYRVLRGKDKSFPYRGVCANSPEVGGIKAFSARGFPAPSPIPSHSGGGCRPQGRPGRENVTESRCGNDRNCGSIRTIFPSASGHVLPLPSSASRGIGGCHLPPLGEGRGGCEFAVGWGTGKVLLRGMPGRHALQLSEYSGAGKPPVRQFGNRRSGV